MLRFVVFPKFRNVIGLDSYELSTTDLALVGCELNYIGLAIGINGLLVCK